MQIYLTQVNLQKLLYGAANYLSIVAKYYCRQNLFLLVLAANYQPGPFWYVLFIIVQVLSVVIYNLCRFHHRILLFNLD